MQRSAYHIGIQHTAYAHRTGEEGSRRLGFEPFRSSSGLSAKSERSRCGFGTADKSEKKKGSRFSALKPVLGLACSLRWCLQRRGRIAGWPGTR
eukprot:311761-Rhodomonas_salina.1